MHLEERVVEELLACPPPRGVLVQTFLKKILTNNLLLLQEEDMVSDLHEIDPLGADELAADLAVERVDSAGIGDAHAEKERILAEDVHVAGDEVTDIPSDQIELVHVRLARPECVSL